MDRALSLPDLSIVPDIVQRTARRVDDLSRKSGSLAGNTELFAAEQVSHADLADALRGFAGEWNRQILSSSQHFAYLASQLAGAAQFYQDTDSEIADKLTSSPPVGWSL